MAYKVYVSKQARLCFLKGPKGPITFELGRYDTSDPDEQKFIESCDGFGRMVHLLKKADSPPAESKTVSGAVTTASERNIAPDHGGGPKK